MFLFAIGIISACDTYPKYEIEYTATYPLNGEYYVRHYSNAVVMVNSVSSYKMTIYNTANAGKDSIWVDSRVANKGATFYIFKIEAKADVDNRVFDQSNAVDVADNTQTVTLSDTKIYTNTWPAHDSIYMKVKIHKVAGAVVSDTSFVIAGHRKTGFEPGTGYGQGL
jgi:hypothetical protein